MTSPESQFVAARTEEVKAALEKNNFEVYVAESVQAAHDIVMNEILPELAEKENAKTVSFGGSMTVVDSGVYEDLKKDERFELIDTYLHDDGVLERRREALLSDVFLTGTNALTRKGELVNLDCVGNRIAGIAWGPRSVIVMVSANKIVTDVEAAKDRIKNYVAPMNCIRLKRKTPCTKTLKCMDCSSPDRICNHWLISEKSWPAKRIKLVLINDNIGY